VVSIITNDASLAALDALRGTSHSLVSSQGRVSSGYRIQTATDDAAYWSIATTMKSDTKAMGAVEDALHLGAASVDVAYTGMVQAIDVMNQFTSRLIASREPAVDKHKINNELVELRAQMRSIAESASFNGENLLLTEDGANEGDREIAASFVRSADGSVRVGTIAYDHGTISQPNRLIDETSPGMYGILTQPGAASGWDVGTPNYVFMTGTDAWPSARLMAVDDTTTDAEVDIMLNGTEFMRQQMVEAAARLGAIGKQIDSQGDFVSNLRQSADRGVGTLRDADLDIESTRMKALEVREKLGFQSLSIANSNTDSVVSLFQ
jgi:flagellin